MVWWFGFPAHLSVVSNSDQIINTREDKAMTEGNGRRRWQCFVHSSWQRASGDFPNPQHPSSPPSSAADGVKGQERKGGRVAQPRQTLKAVSIASQ